MSQTRPVLGLCGLIALLLSAGCGDGEYPAVDQCITAATAADAGSAADAETASSDGEEAPADPAPAVASDDKWCTPCQSDSDCVIAGDPCCHPDLKYVCVHGDRIDDLPSCAGACTLPPAKPDNALCKCVNGTCHLPPINP